MLYSEENKKKLYSIKNTLKDLSPLIHCITNPISINDCANAVLAVGAKPIMAEHPEEVCEITEISSALCLNLGNITDARIKSIMLSGKKSAEIGIRSVIDIVGAGCSSLRLNFAKEIIKKCSPCVIKGNISELKALLGVDTSPLGIDAGRDDMVTEENRPYIFSLLSNLSENTGSVIVASGKTDIIAYKNELYTAENGCEKMSLITGTGCMLNVLIGSMLSAANPIDACLFAVSYFGVCGELADNPDIGTGSFRTALTDNLFLCSEEKYCKLCTIYSHSDYL